MFSHHNCGVQVISFEGKIALMPDEVLLTRVLDGVAYTSEKDEFYTKVAATFYSLAIRG